MNTFSEIPINPINPNLSFEGSSDCAIVKLGCSVASLGSDTFGELRIGASYSGVCCLKPTSNRISKKSADNPSHIPGLETSWGPISNSVDDLAILMEALCQPEVFNRDPMTAPILWDQNKFTEIKKVKIGYVAADEFWPPPAPFQRAILEVTEILKKQGHLVVEIKLPSLRELVSNAFIPILSKTKPKAGLSAFKKALLMPNWLRGIYSSFLNLFYGEKAAIYAQATSKFSPHNYRLSLINCLAWKQQFWEIWKENNLDCLLLPYHSIAPLPDSEETIFPGQIYSLISNILDIPCGSIPVTRVKADEQEYLHGKEKWAKSIHATMQESINFPISIQVATSPYREELCLNIMKNIENSINF